MPEMDIDDLIERWRLVTAELDPGTAKPEWWQDGPVGHFPHAFRPQRPAEAHPIETAIYETVGEFVRTLRFRTPAARLLIEPLYMLACSYELAYWILSPLAPEAASDPFAPFVALWEAGVSLGFAGEGGGMRALQLPTPRAQ